MYGNLQCSLYLNPTQLNHRALLDKLLRLGQGAPMLEAAYHNTWSWVSLSKISYHTCTAPLCRERHEPRTHPRSVGNAHLKLHYMDMVRWEAMPQKSSCYRYNVTQNSFVNQAKNELLLKEKESNARSKRHEDVAETMRFCTPSRMNQVQLTTKEREQSKPPNHEQACTVRVWVYGSMSTPLMHIATEIYS